MATESRLNFLSIQDVADQSQVSKMTVCRHVQAGKLMAYRVGTSGFYAVPQDAAVQYIKKSTSAKAGTK